MVLKKNAVTEIPGVRDRWPVNEMNVSIDKIQLGNGEWLEFISEHPVQLTAEEPSRDVYFQCDDMGEEDLAYFSLEMFPKQGTVLLREGNYPVAGIELGDVSLIQSSK